MPESMEFSRHGQIGALTALRGVSALWVVMYHYRQYDFEMPLVGLWSYGYLAVDIFFMLSGSIMVYVYGEAFSRRTFSYSDFLVKRLARIYPVHLVTMALMVCLYLASMFAKMDVDPGNLEGIWINIFLLQAWGLQENPTLNYPSWSISAEFFAYLLFPIFAAVVMAPKRDFAFALGFLCAALWVFGFNLLNGYSLLSSELFHLTWDISVLRIVPEFLVGAALAVSISRVRRDGITLLLPALVCQAAALYFHAPILFVAVTPMLISGLYLVTWRVPRWSIYLGTISYSLYMVHAVVEKVVFKALGIIFHWEKGGFPASVIFIVALIAVAAAHVLYRVVEHPCRDLLLNLIAARRVATGAAEK